MTPLYLTRIELSDFRTFAQLDVTLAPRAGVLIVHGSNGLGKSSLFDALEWTLTDEIDHFRQTSGYAKFGSYLSRHGDRNGPTSAALTFSDDNRIERQLATIESTSSTLKATVDDITEFLRRSDWDNPISNLNRYLLLTHFLGQSTLSRLTHRHPTDRFQILEEVSRSADLQRFGVALHGPGNTIPARAFAARINSLRKSADELKTILDQEAETWAGAQVSGALDDVAAAALARESGNDLLAAWPLISRDPLPENWNGLGEVSTLQAALDLSEEEVRSRGFAVTEAQRLLALRQQHQAALAGPDRAAEQAGRDVAAATQAVENARSMLAGRQEALDAALASFSAAREDYSWHTDLRQAWETLEQARALETRMAALLGVADSDLAHADAAVERRQRLVQIETRLQAEIERIDGALSATADSREAAQQWLAHDDAATLAAAELQQREAGNPLLGDEIVSAEAKLAAAQASATEAEHMLALVESSVEALSAAISSIVEHLPDDMDHCPVCDTKFGEPAELHARARAAATRLAPVLSGHQAAHRRVLSALAEAHQTHSKLSGARDRLEILRQDIGNERFAAASLLERQGWEADWSRVQMEDLIETLDGDRRRLETRRGLRARWLSRLAQRSTRPSDTTRRRDDAERARTAAARQADDARRAERIATEAFTTCAARLFPGETGITIERIDAAITAAASRQDEAQTSYDTASRGVTEMELRIGSLQQAEESLKGAATQALAAKTNAETALAALAPRWRTLGWTDDNMIPPTIEAAASDVNRAKTHIAAAAASLGRLRAGREAWARQSAHKAAFERLYAQVDLAPNSSREQIRGAVARKLEDLEAEAEATSDAKVIASAVSTEIADAVTKFNSDYIKPLDELTKQINRAILCDERISIDHSVGKRRITQSAGLKGQLPPNMKVDPALIHSEGQMAALAVSMLCGASLTYPWSRWRGLVFDDPLQHNDAIHASAFADLISNLVEAKDYQVLLSTHDLAQAEFLRRKFDARGLPCAVLNLLGLGDAGVEWEFIPPRGVGADNAAASA